MIRKAVYVLAIICSLVAAAGWVLSDRYCAGVRVSYTDRSELFVVVEGGAFTVERLRDLWSTGGGLVSQYEWGVSVIERAHPIWTESRKVFGENVCWDYYCYNSPLSSQAWDADGSYTVRVPFWFISLGLLSVPLFAFSLRTVFRFRRRRRNQCVACGYSLKGNVSGVCPECGARREQCKAIQVEGLKRDS